jgi:hypothetical protein
MPKVRFTGKVYPQRTNFNSAKSVTINWGSSDLGFPLVITLTIINGEAQAVCDVERFEDGHIQILLYRSYNLAEAFTDLASFGTGIAFRVEFDRIFKPDEPTGQEIFIHDVELSDLCKSFKFPPRNSIENFELDKLLTMVLGDPTLMGSLRDLAEVLSKFGVSPTNCARVFDSLRKHVAPGERDKKKGWRKLQAAINADENYLNWVSSYSTDARHGDYVTPLSSTIVGEIRTRTWIVMDRFIEYRKGGNVDLDPIKFPMLVHDSSFPFPTPRP